MVLNQIGRKFEQMLVWKRKPVFLIKTFYNCLSIETVKLQRWKLILITTSLGESCQPWASEWRLKDATISEVSLIKF